MYLEVVALNLQNPIGVGQGMCCRVQNVTNLMPSLIPLKSEEYFPRKYNMAELY
jgi:hypothetical protein